ncbi:unnamed protein product [Lupinus luteus]|uniref:Uncharacterized protein n=1 Tax=Lupinus luteus TaxID=3873 RepID=A0AAV1WX75_LUPLU
MAQSICVEGPGSKVAIHACTVEFFKWLADSIGNFIKLDEEAMNMDILDVGRVLMVVPTNDRIHVTWRIWIGYVLYSIRMIKDDTDVFADWWPSGFG